MTQPVFIPSPIPYPTTGGQRHSPASATISYTLPNNVFRRLAGWTKIEYNWDVTIEELYSNHPDPIGHTLGQAKYTASIEMPLAEYNAWLMNIASLYQPANSQGPSFGAAPLLLQIAYSENGFDTIVDSLLACRFVKGGGAMSNDPKPILRSFDIKPLKILPNGVDYFPVPVGSFFQL